MIDPPAPTRSPAAVSPPVSKIERLFDQALELDPAERTAFLARVCGDSSTRYEVASLLEADEQASGFLDPPPAPEAIAAGAHIGPYRVTSQISERETSSVYLAERDDGQYRQRVAIKLLRPGIAPHRLQQRFHQERQILASLDHPHIAKLLDGGSTRSGQPYLVMEYVDGEPLDVYCRNRDLPLAARLELVNAICQAVHFAHRSLVVHRDLKPSNILVTSDGIPKLLDFGIAKLLDPERLGPELAGLPVDHTATVARVMTPSYASPEQVLGQPISTASDIYSLGVVLYELVAGRRPYELGASLREIERTVCEAIPLPPSQYRAGAVHRGRWPRDLDPIVLMALRKEPERRYASAHALADDLRRCLEHRPVRARRDTLAYLLSSYVRRHIGAVAAAALVVLALLGGAIATAWQWREAVAERAVAESQRGVTERALGFVVDLFSQTNGAVPIGDMPASDLMARGTRRLIDDARLSPSMRATLQHTLGLIYFNLGDYARAADLYEAAISVRLLDPEHALELADSLYQLGSLEGANGEPVLALERLQRALAIRTRLLGDTEPVADVLESLAYNAGYKVAQSDAEDYARRALDIRRREPIDAMKLSYTMAHLAELYSHSGRHEQADRLVRDAIAIRDRGRDLGGCLAGDEDFFDNIALLHLREGYFADADLEIDRALVCLRRLYGPGHPNVVDVTSAHVTIWREQGRYAEAEALGSQLLKVRRELRGDGSPAHDNALYHLAYVLYQRGALGAAELLAELATAIRETRYGHAHRQVAKSLVLIGEIRLAGGHARQAEAAFREALGISWQTHSEEPPEVARGLRGLAEALFARNQIAAAVLTAYQALALQQASLRPSHPEIASTLVVLGASLQTSEPALARRTLRAALAIRTDALGPDHPLTAATQSLVGECQVQRMPADAEARSPIPQRAAAPPVLAAAPAGET